MKPRPENAAQPGRLTDSLSHAVCSDCGELLSDWIIDFDGSTLCLPCADYWEPYNLDEGVGA
jgi:formylmethanofuran dehydrogenase subunit E